MLPLIGVTMGDPAGIGPEVVVKALPSTRRVCRPVIVGDVPALVQTAATLRSGIQLVHWQPGESYPDQPGVLPVLALSELRETERRPGRPCAAGGEASYRYVEKGTRLSLRGTFQALVTAPISKAMWHAAGHSYPGHTELLATLTGTQDVRMMLVGARLRVILVTTHIPLAQVSTALTRDRIHATLELAARHLERFHGISAPRLAVAGLNPHAGEAGILGQEERTVITPAVRDAQNTGIRASGPFPADSVFVRATRGEFDGVICLYHDQGLIPLKLLSWEDGVNVTLGLPIIRTSPDHGTAYDIAGQGRADPRSLAAALALAVDMARIDAAAREVRA